MSDMKPQPDIKKTHTIVHGRVQGVGFRYFVQQIAVEHHILGWVRNRIDRTVEIEAEGISENMDVFLKLVSQGPSGSRVDNMESVTLPGKSVV